MCQREFCLRSRGIPWSWDRSLYVFEERPGKWTEPAVKSCKSVYRVRPFHPKCMKFISCQAEGFSTREHAFLPWRLSTYSACESCRVAMKTVFTGVWLLMSSSLEVRYSKWNLSTTRQLFFWMLFSICQNTFSYDVIPFRKIWESFCQLPAPIDTTFISLSDTDLRYNDLLILFNRLVYHNVL